MKTLGRRYGLDISDSEHEVLTVNLRRIVDALGTAASQLHWRLFHLWAVGRLPGPRGILDYESLAASSDSGASLTWEEVLLLADSTDQIIDAVFAGFLEEPDDRLNSTSLMKSAALVVEANDSTFWRVLTRDPHDVELLRAVFSDVAPVPDDEMVAIGG